MSMIQNSNQLKNRHVRNSQLIPCNDLNENAQNNPKEDQFIIG